MGVVLLTLSSYPPSAEGLEPLPDYYEALHLHALKAQAFEVDQRLFDAINRELAWKPTAPGRPSPTAPRSEQRTEQTTSKSCSLVGNSPVQASCDVGR